MAELRARRTVATRVLLSYALITAALALVTGWGVVAQRRAAQEAELIRSGYLPLSLALRDAVHGQDSWNIQLNHITTALNPVDKRVWFDTALKVGRPKAFGEVRSALSRAFVASSEPGVRSVGMEMSREATQIEQSLAKDKEELGQLFESLSRGDMERAETLRDSLVTRGSQGKRRLSELETRVELNVDQLLDGARARERTAVRLAVGLGVFAVLVGLLAALYARRLLRPLGAVTERAKAVARGDLTPRPVVASSDEIGELAGTFESMVSAIQRANEQLVASERLATIGKMAALVTHEIRNPLSALGLNVELLEEELVEADDETASLLKAIKGEVERLSALSDQYLSVARQRPTQLEREDLAEVVQEALDFIRKDLERRGVNLDVDLSSDLPLVLLDEAQTKQAVFNLVRNAADAMQDGGDIHVAVRQYEGRVQLLVEDEGTGIDADTRAHLFEPFFSTKSQGTGLGLPITRQIVEAHGGEISVEAREPRGTCFTISLPVADAVGAARGSDAG